MSRTFTRNHQRILVLPTQLSKFLEPEWQSGQFFTWCDSALFTESNNLSGVRKIFTGKNLASRNSAFLCVLSIPLSIPRHLYENVRCLFHTASPAWKRSMKKWGRKIPWILSFHPDCELTKTSKRSKHYDTKQMLGNCQKFITVQNQ